MVVSACVMLCPSRTASVKHLRQIESMVGTQVSRVFGCLVLSFVNAELPIKKLPTRWCFALGRRVERGRPMYQCRFNRWHLENANQ